MTRSSDDQYERDWFREGEDGWVGGLRDPESGRNIVRQYNLAKHSVIEFELLLEDGKVLAGSFQKLGVDELGTTDSEELDKKLRKFMFDGEELQLGQEFEKTVAAFKEE